MGDTRVLFKCATAVILCAARAVHVDTRPLSVSAHVRRWLGKLRHLASVRLTCMHIPTEDHSSMCANNISLKNMNEQFQKQAGRKWTWNSPDGHTKNEPDNIITDKPSAVTDVTGINHINMGSDHMMLMGSVTLNTRAERRKHLNKITRTRVDTQIIGPKTKTFKLELNSSITALEERDDLDNINKNMTQTIQQSAMSIAK